MIMVRDNELEGLLPTIDESTMRALHARLAESAERDGLLDVAYRTVDSPVGELLLAATERGLVRVAYLRAGVGAGAGLVAGEDAILAQLAAEISPRVLAAPGRLDPVAHELDEYFTGRRTSFDLPLDFQLARGFRREVIQRLPDIAYGATASYAQVAASAGSPRAVRAVGTACALNPLPIVLPCHRVVRSDGGMGRYAGGPEAKVALLRLEATR
jgi:methylated-DNA-[protein]-cysteine S-methyltransferase